MINQANSLNQYEVAQASVPVTFSYDANGNLATENTENAGKQYTYDSKNRLIKAEVNGKITLFTYDALNRCVTRTINGDIYYNYYDNWELVERYSQKGYAMELYLYGAVLDELITKTDWQGKTVYYHYDALGNVTTLTDKNAGVLERYDYDAFGNPQIKNPKNQIIYQSAYQNNFLFTGREYISELKLYDLRNRIYFPELGRFGQVDPIRFFALEYQMMQKRRKDFSSFSVKIIKFLKKHSFLEEINLYRYVLNSPGNFIDPYGLYTEKQQACIDNCFAMADSMPFPDQYLKDCMLACMDGKTPSPLPSTPPIPIPTGPTTWVDWLGLAWQTIKDWFG